MADPIRNQYEPEEVSRPGETLQEILDDRGMTQAELATRMGRPKKTVNEIIRGKAAITPETALQLEHVLQVPADFWVNRENHYRASLARREEKARLTAWSSWGGRFPVKAMTAHSWIQPKDEDAERVRELLLFFGVASPSAWNQSWASTRVAFRCSSAVSSSWHAMAAWLRAGESQVQGETLPPFDAARFETILREIRQLTRSMPSDFADRIREKCSDAGVAVAFVPEVPKAPVYGATRWIGTSRPLLQLSLRYKSDDQFWFSFFHEACHILRHGKKKVFIECDRKGAEASLEKDADEFAAQILIPEQEYRNFVQREHFSEDAIRAFAGAIGISAGIVVGRLQHDRRLPFSNCNDLKVKLRWSHDPGHTDG